MKTVVKIYLNKQTMKHSSLWLTVMVGRNDADTVPWQWTQ